MSATLSLADIHRAWDAQDPDLVAMLCRLAKQDIPDPETPHRDGAPTFDKFIQKIKSREFLRKPQEEQEHYRIEQVKALEADDAEVPLADRYKLHEFIYSLWEQSTGKDASVFARTCLLEIIAEVPLVYGPWKALKKIFKESEAADDTEIFGALAARFDLAYANREFQPRRETMGYLVRRAWRYLRRVAESLPACYADTAVDFLANYTTPEYGYYSYYGHMQKTWVFNHIVYHETGKYGWRSFTYWQKPDSMLKHRAYAELWQRTPRPLFSLLERAKCDDVREFATTALKTDFRAVLREVEPSWVARLVAVESEKIDEFVVWILNNVPRFEQSAFRELGLHDAVLKLFDSKSEEAKKYAAEYARTHARDLPVDMLVRLAASNTSAVSKLAADLLLSRDPRKEVGLEAWGKLLETYEGHKLAADVIRKHFGVQELTPEWFQDRLLGKFYKSIDFAKKLLPQLHPLKKLGPGFFCQLMDRLDFKDYLEHGYIDYQTRQTGNYALQQLAKFDQNTLDVEFLKRLILHPLGKDSVIHWIDEGKLKAESFPVDFLKAIAYHPLWEEDPWIQELISKGPDWAGKLKYDAELSEHVFQWLGDVRRFSPSVLGYDWLMELVQRTEGRYHTFGVWTMIKVFTPADFAPGDASEPEPATEAETEINVDLEGASFVFTGKLATMTRKDAEAKVRTANGTSTSSINKKLNYLVIGDEGSPLYDQGRKGSKQLKAEELNEAGAEIKIISETAFLQMLAGKTVEASSDAVMAGCEKLWEMATEDGPADDPLSDFALKYIRRHHPDICLAETDRPVDPGAEIPAEFLSFERVKPLFLDKRPPLRRFALELATYEFARWSPGAADIIELCEAPYPNVREFVADAMLADDSPANRRYRIDADVLSPEAVYSFCESRDETTRALGMELIRRSPRLKLPEELFRLTESPDREVRGFVIRTLWSLYRDRAITSHWKPVAPPKPKVGAKTRKDAEEVAEKKRGDGPPAKPEQLPASEQELKELLRRILFEIPPGRPPVSENEPAEISLKLKPLPARQAKLSLIDVVRDLAVEDAQFAALMQPLLAEFLHSRGKSEHAACLVALTRIENAHPALSAS